MLQRIQSVWLFFATASIFSMFLFPYCQFISIDGTSKIIKITGVYENINSQIVQTTPFTLLSIVTVIVALIPFILIFYFKNRKLQTTLCYLAMVAIIVHSFWLSRTASAIINGASMEIGNYSIGALLPSIAIFFIIMAIRGIRKDEKLIRSTDRLR